MLLREQVEVLSPPLRHSRPPKDACMLARIHSLGSSARNQAAQQRQADHHLYHHQLVFLGRASWAEGVEALGDAPYEYLALVPSPSVSGVALAEE